MAKLNLPPLNAVRAFEAAARRGSFVEAAADLNVTHWAIGKQIRLLEDWLGVPLFERKSSGVALTDEGAELSNDVSVVLYRLSEATGKLRRPEVTRRVSGVVRVNVQPSFALRWLFPRLARFQEQFSNIEVRVSTTSRKLRYIGSAFDVGIRSAPEKSTGLRSEILMADRRIPACSPALLRKRPVRTVDDLRHHVILHSVTTRSAWSQWFRTAGAGDLKAMRQLELEHVYLQLQAAVEGLGVALASLPLIEADVAAGRLVCPLSAPQWHAGFYELVTNEERFGNPVVRVFRNWIKSMARVAGQSGVQRSPP